MQIALTALLSLIGFMTGFATGVFWKAHVTGDWVVPFVVVVVTSVWVTSFLVDAFSVNYDPPSSIYPIMTAVIGLLGASRLKGGNSNGSS